MDIDIEKLKGKLEKSIVLITFESLKSGKIYSREYTLSEKHCDIPIHIKMCRYTYTYVWWYILNVIP